MIQDSNPSAVTYLAVYKGFEIKKNSTFDDLEVAEEFCLVREAIDRRLFEGLSAAKIM